VLSCATSFCKRYAITVLSCSGKRFAVTVVPNILEILSIASLVEVIAQRLPEQEL